MHTHTKACKREIKGNGTAFNLREVTCRNVSLGFVINLNKPSV